MKTLSLVALALVASSSQAQKAAPVFEDGQAQIVAAFKDKGGWIVHDLWVETEFDTDGNGRPDRMHVDVTRPGQTDTEGLRVPVIYETSPYFSGVSVDDRKYFWDPGHELGATPPERPDPPAIVARTNRPQISRSLVRTWVPRGFAVVHSCSPGTGLSDGCPTVGGENEALAPKAVIDWLNGRAKGFTERTGGEEVTAEWCTGKVGMTGTSYNGTLPIAAATTGVEGLEAIIPIAPNTSYYHYYRANGLVRHPGGYMGEDVDVLFNFIHSGDPERRDFCNQEVRDKLIETNLDRESGDWSEWWSGRNYRTQLGQVKAATLIAHGFNDWNVMPSHSVEVYHALRDAGVPTMAFFHQGGHGGGPTKELVNKWFTRYLYDVENGVEDEPRAWVVREGQKRSQATPYADYPHPEASMVTLFPSEGGERTGGLVLKAGYGQERLVDDAAVAGAVLANAPAHPSRLLYATPRFEKEVHLSGTARVTVRLASSAPAANFSVWLVALPWENSKQITDDVITRGWADPQNHAALDKSAPLVPGEFVDLSFDLEPDDQVIPVGAQIGLMLFSSDHDFTLHPEPGTTLTIDLAGTSLQLPIVGGQKEYEAAATPQK